MTTEHKTDETATPIGPASRLDDLRLALSFLTRIPMGSFRHPGTLADAVWAFPLVGVIVGAIGGVVYYGAIEVGLWPMIAALLAVAAMTIATGALHEDGLADVADGFGGGATQSRKLEIMRDSRIGSYGVLALIFSVGLRATAIAAIGSAELAVAVIIAAAVAARAVLPSVMAVLPMARDDGLAHRAGQPGQVNATVSLMIGAGCLVFLLSPHFLLTVFVGGAAILSAMAMTMLARRQIGGQTGDVIGAAQQLAETAMLITAVAVLA